MTEMPDWMRAFVLMGQTGDDPPEYKAVLVADDGELYAVLQGEYEGELRTIKLDAAGRLSAFVIDSTDAWGRMLSIGNAELAVRLGSSAAFDRRGQVVFLENFEAGRGIWMFAWNGDFCTGALDPTSSLSGGYSFKLTSGNEEEDHASIYMRRGIAPVGRVGLEFAFALDDAVEYVRLLLTIDDGTRVYNAMARYLRAAADLEIWEPPGAWVDVGDAGHVGTDGRGYNVMKLVVDTATHKYERLLYNDKEVSIVDYSYLDVGVSAFPNIGVRISCYNRDTFTDALYVDDIILTLAEPAN